MNVRTLVFTDLDGTLLDHDTYDFSPAAGALALLAARQIPVILTSSKTFEEMCEWQQRLALVHPFIIENGSALLRRRSDAGSAVPVTEAAFHWDVFGTPLTRIHAALARVDDSGTFAYRRLTALGIDDLMRVTGLTEHDARAAHQRRYSEPVLWDDDAERLAVFSRLLAQQDLQLVRGGRFHHVMGRTSKALALARTVAWYEREATMPVRSIALGDSPNDCEMLEAADIAVVVKNDHSPALSISNAQTIYTTRAGPAGWQEAIDRIFSASSS